VVLLVVTAIRTILELFSLHLDPQGSRVTFISTPIQYVTALRAMRKHASQLVWYRWLYVSFSRYMWVNDLVEVGASS